MTVQRLRPKAKLDNAIVFQVDPKGGWVSTKVFAAGGKAEFFMNLNPSEGRAEIVRLDQGYANAALRELARVIK